MTASSTDAASGNPLLQDWTAHHGMPPFDRIEASHFESAIELAFAQHWQDIEAISSHTARPDFANTLEALDRSGRLLKRVSLVLHNLGSTCTSPALQAAEVQLVPRLAAHASAVSLHAPLFARVDAVYQQRDALALDGPQRRLLERLHLDFVRAGARLQGDDRARFGAIVTELAQCYTRFSQNLLANDAAFALEVPDAVRVRLPAFLRDALRSAAIERGLGEGVHVVTLSPSLAEPFLAYCPDRALRETVWRARVTRGTHTAEHDNRPVVARIMALRQEQAALLGYASYADYELVDRMAGHTGAVRDLLQRTWEPAKAQAARDRADLEALARQLGEPTPLAAWDWRYLAQQLRTQRFDLDETALKPYFSLERMIEALFDCAGRLFGLRFVEQPQVPLYHPDARCWDVLRADGSLVGCFIGDFYARSSKRSGAWMSVFRSQSGHDGGTLPIVINNCNFAKASPCLLSFDDVRTLFHEFGHGLHGLLSQSPYERLAGTQVLRDYVELPSQLFENWALVPQVLQQHARHHASGEALPAAWLERLLRARRFDQAWATVQYTGPALIDLALHALPNGTPVDAAAFEQAQCAALGVPPEIGLRHGLAHFQHLFASAGYAAGYYVYLWAEVLEADAVEAFEEAGDPFDPATAERLLRLVYSAGNTTEPAAAYRAFRGRDPAVEPMLRKRGLLAETPA